MTKEGGQKTDTTLDDLLSNLVETFAQSKRKGVSKSRIQTQVKKYFEDLNKRLTTEDSPIIHLCEEVVEAGNLVGFTKGLSRRRIVFNAGLVRIEGEFSRRVIREIERAFRENLLDYLDEDLPVAWITKPPKELEADRSAIKDKLLPYAFMKAWTALEFYLEMRVKSRVFLGNANLVTFAKRAQEDLPGNWKDISKVKQPIDYVEHMNEIVDDYLTFPYHNFDEKGRTQLIYRQCFDIHLTSYARISEIQELAKTRHQLVHKGTALFGIPTMQFSYSKVKNDLDLILEFAEWIEQQIRKVDKAVEHAKVKK